ncbi:imidazole glycerol phosphate synthase subunit HisH [Anaerobacillus alkaliphilus]|uniref:Imidazole glycerol phosphate synthase subunit HisH n=1 Tax=Anaerobacillus alkaliphilus TaxID=1548597 RepID=A0A4Q0VXA8_9BACI|nr:imidazole glycerol phosphate synthase subunit HisH [Anaerobacillus alkaliphilus]RXJ02275.1 imidazole glycerol phosphate synthase subunit HisH [Anaerobacillus alkaliphilus]
MNNVVIIDYGMGNLGSVFKALQECGANPFISNNPSDLKIASHIILPGVGSFYKGMENLHKFGWIEEINQAVVINRIPLLGICLGMQLLSDMGYEGHQCEGLGLIPGETILLKPNRVEERIPHVGWNEIIKINNSNLLAGVPNRSDFYFVHSYHFNVIEEKHKVAVTPYCNDFVSIVQNQNIYGVQFHPEKSQRIGFQVIKNFVSL